MNPADETESPQNFVAVYPNPTGGVITLEVLSKNDNDQDAEITVMNMFRQPLQRTTQSFNQHLQATLNFSDRDPEGIYWVRVVVDGQSFLKPITLNR